jgi:hypothetical protein
VDIKSESQLRKDAEAKEAEAAAPEVEAGSKEAEAEVGAAE